MKFFTLFLIFAVAFTGFFGGYRLITGRDFVNLERVSLPSIDLSPDLSPRNVAAQPAATQTPSPTPELTPEDEFEPWWAQTQLETGLWSGPDGAAVYFGSVPAQSYLKVVSPQDGPRLHVFNPATRNYAYVDASAVRPSPAPPEPALDSSG